MSLLYFCCLVCGKWLEIFHYTYTHTYTHDTHTEFRENEQKTFFEQGATKATGHARFCISCFQNINNIPSIVAVAPVQYNVAIKWCSSMLWLPCFMYTIACQHNRIFINTLAFVGMEMMKVIFVFIVLFWIFIIIILTFLLLFRYTFIRHFIRCLALVK